MKIRIGIVGYGNLGRGVETAVNATEDCELVALFTRRDPSTIKTRTGIPVYKMEDAVKMQDKIDVMVLCGGSANDLPEQTPEFAKYFNVIDSFDTHANIPLHYKNVDSVSSCFIHNNILFLYDSSSSMFMDNLLILFNSVLGI